MQLKHLKTISQASPQINKVTSICWSPNHLRLAVVGINRVVYLYDENGELKEKFPTKPADPKGPKNYIIRKLSFSPDSTKLAVAQSDNIVFVYKLGANWGEKKTICHKLAQPSSVTCLSWPMSHQNELFLGLADGKVKLGNLRTNKSVIIYSTEDYVVSICSNPKGTTHCAGHLDGSIYIFSVTATGAVSKSKLVQHSSVPYCLSWGESIMAAGNDAKVVFYTTKGEIEVKFDYGHDAAEKEYPLKFSGIHLINWSSRKQRYTVAEATPSGQSIVIGSFNRLRAYSFSPKRKQWEEAGTIEVENLYSVTALAWKRDGSRLTIGSLCGAVEMYDACLRRFKYKGKFEMVYVSPSQVIVKRLSNGERIMLSSIHNYEVTKVNVYSDRYLIAYTQTTLLLGDLGNKKKLISEHYAVNSNTYGNNEPLGFCRTEHVSPHLISVRVCEKKNENNEVTENRKIIAYLLDLQTIHLMDFVSGNILAQINHDSKIDWLELNERASKLLFRDKQHALNLFDIATQSRTTLLNLCSYVQWVPKADVVVAQSRSDLCVWYSIDSPEQVTMFPIKGDVIDIERGKEKTEVVIDEGIKTAYLELNEPLIAFGSAIEDKKFEKAADILEKSPPSPETEAMWAILANVTLQARKLQIAERCYHAMGRVAKAKFLHKVNQIANYASKELGITPPEDYYMVKAQLAILEKKFSAAENILLEQGQVEEVMEMYQELHKWDDSIRVAEAYGHPEVANLRQHYYQWLLETRQEERAAALKEREGDYYEAINLYLALLVKKELWIHIDEDMHTGQPLIWPESTLLIELSLWKKNGQIGFALLANQYPRAIDSAIESRQWNKAVSIVDNLSQENARKYYKQIARHYEEILNYELAEKYFVKGNMPEDAVEMYTRANMWEAAHKIAVSYMSEREVTVLYMTQAQRLESQSKYKEAEKLYITVNEQDQAINMYKKAHILVTTYHKDLLKETHLHLAQQLEAEGQFRDAERHYVSGEDWKSAVNMYRANDLWEEAMRVAKQHGGSTASTQVALVWARSVGGEAGISLLLKFGFMEPAVDYALEINHFKKAEDICRQSLKGKLTEVYLKRAMSLEDEGKFQEAETEFIKGGSPKDAIDMYIHQEDWQNATRVAESFDPSSIYDVLEAQARVALTRKEYATAEKYFCQAKKPEEAIKMYTDLKMWDDAERIKKIYKTDAMPNEQNLVSSMTETQMLVGNRQYSSAIDEELKKTVETVQDAEELERAWENAVKLAINHVPERTVEVVNTVAKRLVEMNRHIAAAELLEGIGAYPEAIDVYLLGHMWDRARDLAASREPEHKLRVVEHQITTLLEQDQHERAMDIASPQDIFTYGKFSGILVNRLIESQRAIEAVSILLKYGAAPIPENYALYGKLTRAILALPAHVEAEGPFKNLRKVLLKLLSILRETEPGAPHTVSLEKLALVTHLATQREVCRHKSQPIIAAKLAMALVRYVGDIPADKAYYEAGIACKDAGWNSMAYSYLNRYLDICEAMDEGEAGILENDAPPDSGELSEIPVPKGHYLSEERREDARNWVLQASLGQNNSSAREAEVVPEETFWKGFQTVLQNWETIDDRDPTMQFLIETSVKA